MSDLETNVKSVYAAARALAGDLGKLGAGWLVRSLDDAARSLHKIAERLRNG